MKTIEELRKYVPADKFDNTSIEFLLELKDEEIVLILDDLLIWLKDMNYLVSKELVTVLVAREEVLRQTINDILSDKEEDSIWKYNIINHIINGFEKDNLKHYEKSLKRIATKPTSYELDRETSDLAKLTIDKI